MTQSIHDFVVNSIDGASKSLADYRGNVLLIVNVASECGLTPQYRGLEQLHRMFRDRGLRVLGFPANDFGAQEPGTNEQIRAFCTSKYEVTFDMFAKVKVKGEEMAPLFAFLTSPATNPQWGGDIKWNFNKFLLGRAGEIRGRFEPTVEPTSPELTQAIEAALGQ